MNIYQFVAGTYTIYSFSGISLKIPPKKKLVADIIGEFGKFNKNAGSPHNPEHTACYLRNSLSHVRLMMP
jgi:hypothetical protein